MSKAISGWQTRISWASETAIGTPVTTTVLWNSKESDSLTFGDKPLDLTEMFTGARGALSSQFRTCNYEPGGELGESNIYLDGSSTDFLNFMLTFYQNYTRGTVEGTQYKYVFSQGTDQIAGTDIRAITVLKDTGMGAGKCYQFAGCVIDSLTFSWDFGGAIFMTPTLMALSGLSDGTAPGALTPPTQGYLQAPNITVTFDGTTICPTSFSMTFNNNIQGVPCPSKEAWSTFSFGQVTGEIELKLFRDDTAFYANFVDNYENQTLGTLIISATVDSSYGTFFSGSSYKAVWTAYVRSPERPELAMSQGLVVDTLTLPVSYDVYPTLEVHSLRAADL